MSRPENKSGPAPQAIFAPYNFVPLSSWIWFPDWGSKVSHDFPLRDGLSGVLSLSVKAETPILIGDGGRPNADKSTRIRFLRRADGKCVIPGTSLKGMVRSVMEIAAFGRMQLVDDKVFAFRDLYDKSYQNRLTDTSAGVVKPLSRAGWLKFVNGQWQLFPVSYARIEHEDLAKIIVKSGGTAPHFKESKITALDKYKALPLTKTISFDLTLEERRSRSNPRLPHKLSFQKAVNVGAGKLQGRVVQTGWMKNKHLEFVFYGEERQALAVSNEQFSRFKYVHQKLSEAGVFDYHEKAYRKGLIPGIPVFYLPNARNEPEFIGMAQMPRLRHSSTTHDLIRSRQSLHVGEVPAFDLAELLFGGLQEQVESLRGRVSFDDAIATKVQEMAVTNQTVQAQPKASYHPSYIEQRSQNGELKAAAYNTYSTQGAVIRGWKRYPVRMPGAQNKPPIPESNKISKAAQVDLQPLAAGTVFTGKVRFHNLKPEELGALIWVMQWGGDSRLRHSIGIGKAFGYGQVAINLAVDFVRANDPAVTVAVETVLSDAVSAFERCITAAYETASEGKAWGESAQLTQLMAMANPALSKDKDLRHMPLASFAAMKKHNPHNPKPELKVTGRVLSPYAAENVMDAFPAGLCLGLPATVKPSCPTSNDSTEPPPEEPKERDELEEFMEALRSTDAAHQSQVFGKIKSLIELALTEKWPVEKRQKLANALSESAWVTVKNTDKRSERKALIATLLG